MTLQQWRKLSFQLSADLQTLSLEARRNGLDALADEALALRVRVEDRRFTVAVVGDFRRGKSTFINALLRRSILPSDVAPTTATVNRVTWGSTPSAELRFHDNRAPEVVPIEQLAEHVTKLTSQSAARAAEIREAVVYFPVNFCRNDVDILDTPGLGDETTMTAVTMRQLPSVDAAILVIMADSPFSETEGEFLRRLYAEGVTELLFVVSALDRVRKPSDRERLVTGIRERVAARIRQIADARFEPGSDDHASFLLRRGEPRVFGVSALTALEASQSGGSDVDGALETSGMPAFEGALEQFLTGADQVGLQRRLEQAEALCRQFVAPETKPRAGDGDVERELSRLAALIHALEAAVADHRRRMGDACARSLAALQGHSEQMVPRALLGVLQELPRLKPTANWLSRYQTFAAEVAVRLNESAQTSLRLFGPQIEEQMQAESAIQEEELLQLLRGTALVLDHVETRLRQVGHKLAEPLWTSPKMGPPPVFDIARLTEALTPPASVFRSAVEDPGISTTLAQAEKRSAFDQLMAFDFGGAQGKWVAIVQPRVSAACEAFWSTRSAAALLREGTDTLARRRVARLDPLTQAIRAALNEIVACRERASIVRDRRASEWEESQRAVADLARRFGEARARVGAG